MIYLEKVVTSTVVNGVRKAKVILCADTEAEVTDNMEVTQFPEEVNNEKLTVAKMLNGSICYVPASDLPVYTLSNGSWVEVTGE